MKKLIVEKAVRIPNTKIILEKGDRIIILSEAEATVGIPSNTIVVPYDIPIPGYDTIASSAIIDTGREVKYKVDITEAGFLLTLYYNHLKHTPFKFVKVPILFTSKQEAISKGWNFKDQESKGIMNTIPSGTDLNNSAGVVDSKTMNEGKRNLTVNRAKKITKRMKENGYSLKTIIKAIKDQFYGGANPKIQDAIYDSFKKSKIDEDTNFTFKTPNKIGDDSFIRSYTKELIQLKMKISDSEKQLKNSAEDWEKKEYQIVIDDSKNRIDKIEKIIFDIKKIKNYKEKRDVIKPYSYRDFIDNKHDVRKDWDFETFVSKLMKAFHDSDLIDYVEFSGVSDFNTKEGVAKLYFNIGVPDFDEDDVRYTGTSLTFVIWVDYKENVLQAGIDSPKAQEDHFEITLTGFNAKDLVSSLIDYAIEENIIEGEDVFKGDNYARYGVKQNAF